MGPEDFLDSVIDRFLRLLGYFNLLPEIQAMEDDPKVWDDWFLYFCQANGFLIEASPEEDKFILGDIVLSPEDNPLDLFYIYDGEKLREFKTTAYGGNIKVKSLLNFYKNNGSFTIYKIRHELE